MPTTTISTELTLDDLASEILKQIKSNTEETADAAEHAKGGFGSFARETAALLHNLGINVTQLAGQVLEFGRSFVEAASEGQSADQALGAMIATTQGRAFGNAVEQAGELGDAMDEIAAKTGAVGDVGGAFNELVLYTGASIKGIRAATSQIEGLSQIARVMGRDVGSVTQEFAMMQEGMLKPKSQLFQLLQSTGLFGDNAKKAAAAWNTLTDEKRSAILNAALDQVAGKLEKIPPSFNNQVASLKQMIGAAKEKIGEPFMEALMPAMTTAIDKVGAMTPRMIELAKTLGADVGKWVNQGLDYMAEAFKWIDTHHEEIMSTLREGWSDVKAAWAFIKGVVEFIVANKEAIMAIAAVYGAQQGVKGGADLYKQIASSVASMKGLETQSLALGAAFAIVLAAAVQIATDINKAKADEQDTQIRGARSFNNQVQDAVERGDVEKLKRLKTSQSNLAASGITNKYELGAGTLDKSIAQAEARAAMDTEHIKKLISSSYFDISEAHAAAAAGHAKSAQAHMDAIRTYDVAGLLNAYNDAIAANNEANQRMIEQVLMKSKELRAAFDESTIEITGGMLGMIKATQSVAMGVAQGAMEGGVEGATSKISIGGLTGSGNVTVNMKQDFRNQDPDRVAVAFERSIERMAEHRKTASTSSPFGT